MAHDGRCSAQRNDGAMSHRLGAAGAADPRLIVALLMLGAAVLVVAFGMVGVAALTPGSVPPSDFSAFWVAARMALRGEAALAYDRDVFMHAVSAALGVAPNPLLVWLNPPGFLVLLLPFAMLPPSLAWLAWSIGGVVLVVLTLRVILPRWGAMVAVLAAPASLVNLGFGQNGAITASLLALGLEWLDRRPVAAGFCFGLMTYKPQFGLVLPVLLAATGRWRCFAAAAGTAIALALVSVGLFGIEPWRAFFASLSPNAEFALHPPDWALMKLQSVAVSLLRAGVPGAIAWPVHAAVALGALALAYRLWRLPGDVAPEARAVATLAAMFLSTPYVLVYDGMALGMAGVFLTRAAMRDGAQPGEMVLIALALALPLSLLFVTVYLVLPASWLIMLGLAVRRGMGMRASAFGT